MGFKRALIFVLILFQILLGFSAFASQCSSYLQSSNQSTYTNKALQRLEALDPELFLSVSLSASSPAMDLYLILKERAWLVVPLGMLPWKKVYAISEDLKQRWILNYNDKYKIEEMNQTQLSLFYGNYLQSIYSQLVPYIKLELLKKIGIYDYNFDPKVTEQLTRVLDRILIYDLRQQNLDPDKARAAFFEDDYKKIDWNLFANAFAYLNQKTSIEDLDEFPGYGAFGKYEIDLIKASFLGVEGQRDKDLCCKNTPGCMFCPNNLSFMRLK